VKNKTILVSGCLILLIGIFWLAELAPVQTLLEHAGISQIQLPMSESPTPLAPPIVAVTQLPTQPPRSDLDNVYYVSRTGNNTDGRSWKSAWSELDQINWGKIQGGDTILLDGGSSEMMYVTSLTIEKSGSDDKPIILRLADEAGRNGKVVIDGGLTYWPCQSSEPSPYLEAQPPGTRRFGIHLKGQSWVTIDGTKPGGIEIRNHSQEGIIFRGARHIRLSQLHIHHNTYATKPNGSGIDISGDAIILERLDIHHNGQDAIQGGDLSNFVLEESYIHDHYCAHPDGIQLFYGTNRNITIKRNIFAYGFLQAIFLGEADPKFDAKVYDVNISYNLMYSMTYGVKSHNDGNRGWKVYNNTIVDIAEQGIHLFRIAAGAEIRNNILYRSGYVVRNGVQSNNLFYQVPGAPSEHDSLVADPQFVDASTRNYQLRASSPAIDQGFDLGRTNDYLGTAVPVGSRVDIGALEYTDQPAGSLDSPVLFP
jgi:hypothetical protein